MLYQSLSSGAELWRRYASSSASIRYKLPANVAINGMSALLETKNGFVDANLYAFEVARMTDETISSMVQDVTHHKETEIRIITGAVCRLGREHHVPTPCNDLLLQLVLAKQSIYLGR